MKWLFFILIPVISFGQIKDCQYDFEEKTDSTSIKSLSEQIVYEKVFGTSRKFVHFKLLNNDGVPILNIQYVEKSTEFIPNKCLDLSSKMVFQLANGKFVTLKSISENACSSLLYNEQDKSNIRILEGYFVFTTPNYEDLKTSPLSMMRIQFVGDKEDFNFKDELQSEITETTFYPTKIFMYYLKCIE